MTNRFSVVVLRQYALEPLLPDLPIQDNLLLPAGSVGLVVQIGHDFFWFLGGSPPFSYFSLPISRRRGSAMLLVDALVAQRTTGLASVGVNKACAPPNDYAAPPILRV